MVQVTEYIHRKCKDLSSLPRAAKKKQKNPHKTFWMGGGFEVQWQDTIACARLWIQILALKKREGRKGGKGRRKEEGEGERPFKTCF
jgi:hypothetical protein